MALLLFFTPAIYLVALAPLGLSHRPVLYYSSLRLAGYFHGLVLGGFFYRLVVGRNGGIRHPGQYHLQILRSEGPWAKRKASTATIVSPGPK